MAITESVQLLGAGVYSDIPDKLTLKTIPTISELEYVGGEDFDETMIDKIFPVAIEEKINFRNLLEIDYTWLCRCLRILNFGPYFTTNAVYCPACGKRSYGEYVVDLRTIECVPLPEKFVNSVTIDKSQFIDFDKSVVFAMPTIGRLLTAYKDKAFQKADGESDRALARLCYSITSFGGQKGLTPVEIRLRIENDMSPADYIMLKEEMSDLSNYGLRVGGITKCPKCGSLEAGYIALVDDRFFRPSVRDLQQWRDDKRKGANENAPRNASAPV